MYFLLKNRGCHSSNCYVIVYQRVTVHLKPYWPLFLKGKNLPQQDPNPNFNQNKGPHLGSPEGIDPIKINYYIYKYRDDGMLVLLMAEIPNNHLGWC